MNTAMTVKNVAAAPWNALVYSAVGIAAAYINVRYLILGIEKKPTGLVAAIYHQLNNKNI